jgi:hypothetical protein
MTMAEAIDYDELALRFTAHSVDDDAVTCLDAVRAAMRTAALRVLQVVPDGRERALALTKLEETMFWANAGIAREGR